MKRPPIKPPLRAWAVVDTDGRICWGLVDTCRRQVRAWAKHPKRRVVRVGVVKPKRRRP